MRHRILLFYISLFLTISLISFAGNAVNLPSSKLTQLDQSIWRIIEPQRLKDNTEQLNQIYFESSKPVSSLLGHSGGALARLPIAAGNAGVWYVLPVANFVDEGRAYWQDGSGQITQIADFSQVNNQPSAIIMHGQSFKLSFNEPTSGVLWIYLNAAHYPTPVHLTIVAEAQFIPQRFVVNSLTVGAIAVMLALAMMALILFLKTRHKVALFCFGYIGLHAVGWALAAGFIQSMYPMLTFNTTYGGMYVFPFAIGCASYFAFYLFNFDKSNIPHFPLLVKYANFAFCAGVIMWFLSFTWVFYTSHLLAALWIGLSLFVGYRMLSKNDFRAKYFLVGNILYSLSLIFYMLSHFAIINSSSPELVVLIALTLDCVCILLSLSEWLRLKQQEFQKVMYQSRFDALTKVGNRLLLNDQLENLETNYLVVFIDCDGIKKLNDTLGHAEGDIFLTYVAELMTQELAGKGQVFRTGGDEFIWLCEFDKSNQIDALKLDTKQLLDKINKRVVKRWPQSGISYGIACNSEANSVYHCLSLADSRMYEFKAKHKAHA
jgi:diguanylate cyclase (GGDEF)-like protein